MNEEAKKKLARELAVKLMKRIGLTPQEAKKRAFEGDPDEPNGTFVRSGSGSSWMDRIRSSTKH